jgi:hypothetical protein
MRDPINKYGVDSPTINPKQKGRRPNNIAQMIKKKQCKYKNKYWIRSKRTEHEAMALTNSSKRTISKLAYSKAAQGGVNCKETP